MIRPNISCCAVFISTVHVSPKSGCQGLNKKELKIGIFMLEVWFWVALVQNWCLIFAVEKGERGANERKTFGAKKKIEGSFWSELWRGKKRRQASEGLIWNSSSLRLIGWHGPLPRTLLALFPGCCDWFSCFLSFKDIVLFIGMFLHHLPCFHGTFIEKVLPQKK